MDDTFTLGDRRLKVLWIDDKPADIFPKRSELENHWSKIYVIHSRKTPEAVAADFEAIRRQSTEGRHASNYALAPGPYDVILADFRMSEPPGGRPSLAARAPAAGLTIAVLAAFQCPEHPVAIIPYSAYSEEFGNQYELLKLGWPDVVHVVNDPLLHKIGEGGTSGPLLRASTEYREALLKSVGLGVCHVAMREQLRWRKLLSSTGEIVRRDECLEVATPWGQRTIGIDALFADKVTLQAAGVPASAVGEWLAKLPVPSDVERRAREIADVYWALACSKESWSRYYLARELAKGRTFDDLDLSQPPEVSFEPLYSFKHRKDVEGYAPIRLATLFLMLRAIGDDLESIEAARVVTESLEHPDVKAAVEDYLTRSESASELREALLDLATLAAEARAKQRMPLTEADIVRLVDPLPAQWKINLTLNRGEKIGKELETRVEPAFDVKALLAGNGTCLQASERESARRYALEVIKTPSEFPAWLR